MSKVYIYMQLSRVFCNGLTAQCQLIQHTRDGLLFQTGDRLAPGDCTHLHKELG